ncbi:store-operated calcium entry regulator STIMATE [Procambarus clarkii]|uniref:store-operated calcium entry regulator STIMATE n=1 Tax=Procambarus clarkii TaxID=6728 RepID=UPI001E675DD4|nr:store-operated calcium entry regulator STIMATE-like [Procambarus clarkii]
MSGGNSLQPMDSLAAPLINTTIDVSVCGKDALTDSYGWFVQALLASLAFGLLILKRFCEPKKHRRSWLVWFYDTSKQGLGAMIVHFCNVFLSEAFRGDPCTWYIISFLLDSTLGLVIIWAGIRLSIYIGQKQGMPTIIFGEYGRPPSARAWGHQCALYVGIMIVEKVLITGLLALQFWSSVRDLILAPITDPQVRVVIVVLVIPFFINALIFWVTDNFLMLKVRPVARDEEYAFPNDSTSGSRAFSKVHYKCHDVQHEEESDILLTTSNDDELLGKHENLQERHVGRTIT